MYQPSCLCGSHMPLLRGLSQTRVLDHGGAIGIQFKSNIQFNWAYAKRIGLSLEGCSGLSIIYA